MHGILVSQIGYNTNGPKRLLVRGPDAYLSDASFKISDSTRNTVLQGDMVHWGQIWQSDWWVGDFTDLTQSGTYSIQISNCKEPTTIKTDDIIIAPDRLWTETWEAVSVTQAECRRAFAYDLSEANAHGVTGRIGWFDAGMYWQEANSHSAFLLGLCDLVELQADRIADQAKLSALHTQLINGADYLAHVQLMARAQGHGDGPLVHQVIDRPMNTTGVALDQLILPGDTAKAAAALARVATVLPVTLHPKRQQYMGCARKALDWVLDTADYSCLPFNSAPHAVAADFAPDDSIPTSDLAMLVSAATYLEHPRLFDLVDLWLSRQVKEAEAHDGVYGHFRLINAPSPTERSWWHGVGTEGMGYNNGQSFGHNLLPLINLLKRFPDHDDAAKWHRALRDYTYGYFIPGCSANPFYLAPVGHYRGQGFIWFAGLWHGCNAVYGNAAALALELNTIFAEPVLSTIANGNMQWVAGLNAGVTRNSLSAAYMCRLPIPTDTALPCSMINGIGHRTAGSWLNIRGAICNGFATGKQFTWDVQPAVENDAPSSFTDEDWITHAGGWLSGLSRLTPALSQ